MNIQKFRYIQPIYFLHLLLYYLIYWLYIDYFFFLLTGIDWNMVMGNQLTWIWFL